MSRKLFWNDCFHIEKVIADLKGGNVVLGTSDTVLGLLADVQEGSFEALNRIKRRERKPYLLLVSSFEAAKSFIMPNQLLHIEKLIAHFWPGPLTIIVTAPPQIPPFMTSYEHTIGLRVPAHPGLQQVLPHFKALFSTSANLAGKPIPRRIEDIDPEILSHFSYVIVDDEHERLRTQPSTILDCTTEPITVVREGAYSRKELEQVYGKSFNGV